MSKRRDVLLKPNPRDKLEPVELRSIVMTPETMLEYLGAQWKKAADAGRKIELSVNEVDVTWAGPDKYLRACGTGEIMFSLKLAPMDEAGITAAKDAVNKKLGE